MKKRSILMLGVACLLLSSCVVSKKKFEIAEAGRLAALYSRDSLAELLGMTRTDYAILDELRNNLLNDTTLLKNSIRNYQQLVATGQNENQKLSANLKDREKTIAELQKMIAQQNQKVKDLLKSVKDALLGFSSDELTVREEGGKVYVAMSDKLLFESGKAIVNEQGREALGKLAGVLNRQTDIDVYIEGHTDNVPIKTPVFQDNWDLSVIRATSVVRILTETYGVNPLQILPCGRGEFKPVDVNTTTEGKARNRRTEIIMAPQLDKLFKMLEESGQ
ncbi:MAG: OmpA family protein [Bacteroidaceae bacterium]|nr:OmpA family protein [Bacteroidaceae bacterium]MBQ6226602.1 OmpA family protein [Bacteroidaceae bacterium]